MIFHASMTNMCPIFFFYIS